MDDKNRSNTTHMSSDKERLDLLLLEQGYFESREKAKAAIMAGLVFADEEPVDKAGMKISRKACFQSKGCHSSLCESVADLS